MFFNSGSNQYLDEVINREKGQFNISIGTSLALESLVNIHPDIQHNDLPIKKFNSLHVNLRTLFRNAFGSINREVSYKLDPSDMIAAITTDIEELERFTSENHIELQLYHSEYDNLSKLKHAKLRQAKTNLQLIYYSLLENTIKLLFKEKHLIAKKNDKDNDSNIIVYNNFIEPNNNPNVGILTHVPYDLLKSYSFSKLILIESHTGAIKKKDKWYTKYHVKDLPPIPFRLELLHVFGDSEMFFAMPKKLREPIIAIAKKYRWTPITTKDKILTNLQTHLPIEEYAMHKAIFDYCKMI